MRTPFFLALLSLFTLCLFAVTACQSPESSTRTEASDAAIDASDLSVATFAGGCFWCMQPPFDRTDGVHSTIVGYTGGEEDHPTYEEVSRGLTTHVEAVEVRFDPAVVSYDELLDVFWRSIDPTDDGGQFADRGPHYRTAIFYHDEDQRLAAEASRDAMDRDGPFDDPIVTELRPAETFWIGEDYHQDYYLKNSRHYQAYYAGSGRKGFLETTWGTD